MPANGSSLVILARSMAPRTIVSMPSGVRSEVYDDPPYLADQHTNSGGTRARFFQTLNLAHADGGGKLLAFHDGALGVRGSDGQRRFTASAATFSRSLTRGSTHGHFVDLHGRNADAHRHALSFFSAHADALVELQVVAHHADVFQSLRSVADQRRAAHRPRQLAVFDQITFRRGENEVAAGDVHLSSAESRAIQALLHGLR